MKPCTIYPAPCDQPAVDRVRFVNPNMDWHGDELGEGDACSKHLLPLVDPLHHGDDE